MCTTYLLKRPYTLRVAVVICRTRAAAYGCAALQGAITKVHIYKYNSYDCLDEVYIQIQDTAHSKGGGIKTGSATTTDTFHSKTAIV